MIIPVVIIDDTFLGTVLIADNQFCNKRYFPVCPKGVFAVVADLGNLVALTLSATAIGVGHGADNAQTFAIVAVVVCFVSSTASLLILALQSNICSSKFS